MLADELLDRPPGDPGTVFACYMCAYAREVLLPSLPGPYTNQQTRRFAQAALIPAELLEREHINTRHAAATLGLPEPELADGPRQRQGITRHVAHGRLTPPLFSSPPLLLPPFQL